jgi:DNA-binding FrmR family transcriptional regulator
VTRRAPRWEATIGPGRFGSPRAVLASGGLEQQVTRWTFPKEADMRGYTLDKDDYLLRLRKIEGQVRGLQRLVEDDTYCIDILTQIASVNAALQKVALGLVDQHLRHCVMGAMDTDPDVAQQRLTDATLAVQRLLQL